MIQSPFIKRDIVIVCILSICVVLTIFFAKYFNTETTIVFCDVGQGDATYIRLKNKIDIVIDAGPNSKILHCLGKYMPFYDRSIEYAFISHPQKDHFGGFIDILARYSVKSIWMPPINNEAKLFTSLKKILKNKKISIKFPTSGTKIRVDGGLINVLWPELDYIKKNAVLDPKTDPVFLVTGKDLNEFSLIFTFEVGGVKTVFTGDSSQNILNRLLNQDISNTDIIKIPHHGSKNGLSKKFLKLAQPMYAVISVSKNNSYGHPSPDVLNMLKAANTKIRRTDFEGDIVFKLAQ